MRSGYLKHLEKSFSKKKIQEAITKEFPPLLVIQSLINKTKPVKQFRTDDHPYATMSQNSYKRGSDRNVPGYDIDESLSRDDITVYKHRQSNNVILAFRGTDLSSKVEKKKIKSPKDLWYSRGFRDFGADASLATYSPEYNHRFYNYKKTTQDAIRKYGQQNVKVTGHSLGGSGALWISNELHVRAVAHNPFVHPLDAMLGTSYPNAVIRLNPGDPISTLSPWAHTTVEMDNKHKFEHGIQNWVDKEKGMTKPTITRNETSFTKSRPTEGALRGTSPLPTTQTGAQLQTTQ